jgi:hypothetical protein
MWLPVIAALALGASVQSSFADIVLQDNFDSSAARGNWAGDSVFQSIPQPGNVQAFLPSIWSGQDFFQNSHFRETLLIWTVRPETALIPLVSCNL